MPISAEVTAAPGRGAHFEGERQHKDRQKYTNLFSSAEGEQLDIRAAAAEVDAQVRELNAEAWLSGHSCKDAMPLNQTGELECCKDDDVARSTASLTTCETSEDSCKQEVALLHHKVEPNIRDDESRELSVGASQSTCESSQHSAEEPCDTARSAGQPEEEPGAEPPPAAETLEPTLRQAPTQEDDAPQSPPMKLYHISDALEACADYEESEESTTNNTRRASASQSAHLSPSRHQQQRQQQQKDDRSQTRKSKRSRAELLLW